MERPPRYSKRQITKRPFKQLGAVEQSRKCIEEQNISNKTDGRKSYIKDMQSVTPKRMTTNGNISRSSTSQTEQNENRPKDGLSLKSPRLQTEIEHTPNKLQRFNDREEGTPTPGDVSVTFLASTPKPGRPQLSRRRPLSSVRENSDAATISQTSSKSLDVLSTASKSTTPRKQCSIPVMSFDNSKWKQKKSDAGRSMEDKMNMISKAVVEKKRQSPRKSSSISNSPRSGTKSVSRDAKSVKNGSLTVPVHSATRSNSQYNIRSHSEASDDDDQALTKTRSVINRKSVKDAKKVNKKSIDVRNVKHKNVKKSRKKVTAQNDSDSSDGTSVPENSSFRRRTSTSSIVRSSPEVTQTKSKKGRFGDHGVLSHRDVSRTVASRSNVPKDCTITMWQTSSQKRSRRDVMDLDLVLNSVTETLQSSRDVYELDDGQAAVRLLEKYLVKDITHMIEAAQTVTNLQTRIKQSERSLKLKQKQLMSLQKENVELEEKCLPSKTLREKNEKMASINDFLSDLKAVVNQC